MFGHKKKVREGHRFWDLEELYGLCFSQDGLVARVGEKIDTGCWWAILEGSDCLVDLGTDGKIIL
jgi:hypothetical protein